MWERGKWSRKSKKKKRKKKAPTDAEKIRHNSEVRSGQVRLLLTEKSTQYYSLETTKT